MSLHSLDFLNEEIGQLEESSDILSRLVAWWQTLNDKPVCAGVGREGEGGSGLRALKELCFGE